jgi:hypothetical protein
MEQQVHTFESVWAAIQESNRFLTEKQSETDRLMKENNRLLTEKQSETERLMQETERLMKENALFLKEQRAETERFLKERFAETDRIVKDLAKEVGGMSNNNGLIAEEYFFNAFQRGEQNFFGEKFDRIMKNKSGVEIEDEYDILLINGQSAGIVEIKYKAHKNDLPKILKKAETFRINFPKYEKHRVYLGLATLAFYSELEEECEKEGIAIIKQTGETVVINDKHLKVF